MPNYSSDDFRDRDRYTLEIEMERILGLLITDLFKAFKEFILAVQFPQFDHCWIEDLLYNQSHPLPNKLRYQMNCSSRISVRMACYSVSFIPARSCTRFWRNEPCLYFDVHLDVSIKNKLSSGRTSLKVDVASSTDLK